MYEATPPPGGNGASPADVGVLVVVGPTNLDFNGSTIPGGLGYALLAAARLADSDPDVTFHFYLGVQEYTASFALPAAPENSVFSILQFDTGSVQGVDGSISSNQHGLMLNHLLSIVDPGHDFLLVLDPDCFVITRGLVSDLASKMRAEGYALAGVPYPYFYPVDYPSDFPTLYFVLMSSTFARERIGSFLPDQSQGTFGGVDASPTSAWRNHVVAIINRLTLTEGGLDLRLAHVGPCRLMISGLGTRLRLPGRHAGDTGYRLRDASRDERMLLLKSVTVTSTSGRRKPKRNASSALTNWSRLRRTLTYEPTSRVGRFVWQLARLDRFLPRADLSHKPLTSVTSEEEVCGVAQVQEALTYANLPDLSRCMVFAYKQHLAVLHLGHQGKTGLDTDHRRLQVIVATMAHLEGR